MAKKETGDPLLLDFSSQLRELNKVKIEGYKPPKFKTKKKPIRFRAKKSKKRGSRMQVLARKKGILNIRKKKAVKKVIISRKAKSKKIIMTRKQQLKRAESGHKKVKKGRSLKRSKKRRR